MNRTMPVGSFFWAAALTFASATLNLQAARIYQIANYPDDQSGHTLSGQIVTVDAAPNDGLLETTEILSWEYTIDGASPLVASSADYDADTTVIKGTVLITPSEILLEAPSIAIAIENSLDLGRKTDVANTRPNHSLLWSRRSQPVTAEFYQSRAFTSPTTLSVAWSDSTPTSLGSGPWLIASHIPEPGAAILTGLGSAGLGFFGRRRVA